MSKPSKKAAKRDRFEVLPLEWRRDRDHITGTTCYKADTIFCEITIRQTPDWDEENEDSPLYGVTGDWTIESDDDDGRGSFGSRADTFKEAKIYVQNEYWRRLKGALRKI